MSANWAPQFAAGAPAWQPLFGSGVLGIDSVVPTTTGATVTYSGTATHYRVDGGAAVAVPSNPFTFAGLAPNTEPHTVELSGNGGSSWTAPQTFGTLNPGAGGGTIPTPALVSAAITATVLHRVTAAVVVDVDGAPPPASDVDVAIAATVLHRVTAAVQVTSRTPVQVDLAIAVPVLHRVTAAAQIYWGAGLPPLTRSTMRTIPAGRKTPIHLQALDAAEVDDLAFNFAAKLPAGDSVSSAIVTIEDRVGTDPAPLPLKVGMHQVQGTLVLQRVSGAIGLAGVTYLLRCEATLASGKKLLAAAFMKVTRQA